MSEQLKRVEKAMTNMVLSQPFFATLAMRLEQIETEEIETFATDGERLLINPKWCSTLKHEHIVTVLCHEVMHCFEKDTVIAGADREIYKIKKGEKVISHNGSFNKVLKTKEREYTGEILTIKPRGCLAFNVTPNHPFFVYETKWQTKDRKNKRIVTNKEWVESQNLKSFKREKFNDSGHWLLIPKINQKYKQVYLKIKCNHYKIKKTFNNSIPEKMRQKILLNKDISYFLGLYAADGYSSTVSGESGITLALNQTIYGEKIINIIEKYFGLKSRVVFRDSNCFDIKWNSVSLSRFLKKFIGEDVYSKKIPSEILYGDTEILKEFLLGFIHGDGYINNKSISMATVNKVLATQLQLSFTRFNIFIPVIKTKQGKNKRNIKNLPYIYKLQSNHNSIYNLFNYSILENKRQTNHHILIDDGILIPITKITKEIKTCNVYNMSVEKTETYLANNILTHNCALGHIWRKTEGMDHEKWNIATDHEINLELHDAGFVFPEGGHCADPKYKGWACEKIYRDLPDKQKGKKYDGMGEVLNNQKKEELKNSWAQAVVQAHKVAKGKGTIPSSIEELVQKLTSTKLDWKALLRDFLKNTANNDWTFGKCNQRWIDTGFYMPSLFNYKPGNFVFVIDTSGSISKDILEEFIAEAQSALDELNPDKLTVIFADARINAIDTYETGDTIRLRVVGRGGTDFRPAFEEANKMEDVSCLIYLTDMEGRFPDKEPQYHTLWISNGGDRAPFGQVVKI